MDAHCFIKCVQENCGGGAVKCVARCVRCIHVIFHAVTLIPAKTTYQPRVIIDVSHSPAALDLPMSIDDALRRSSLLIFASCRRTLSSSVRGSAFPSSLFFPSLHSCATSFDSERFCCACLVYAYAVRAERRRGGRTRAGGRGISQHLWSMVAIVAYLWQSQEILLL
mmetsp:Transcript_949/g.1832  ORF Transcript_949/g.1832 Transcript_949/m.1832 type:complete len:167 (-) Transcript_949:7-507(-)